MELKEIPTNRMIANNVIEARGFSLPLEVETFYLNVTNSSVDKQYCRVPVELVTGFEFMQRSISNR